jgi:hypothetical protein
MKQFEIIKDSRFSETPLQDVIEMGKKIEENLKDIAIIVESFPIRKIYFDDCVSYRKTYRVDKQKSYKWNDVYGAVNNVQAPVYKNV